MRVDHGHAAPSYIDSSIEWLAISFQWPPSNWHVPHLKCVMGALLKQEGKMCVWYTNVFSSCCTICKEFPRLKLNAFSMEQDTRYQPLDGNKFCKAQRLNVNSWPSPFHSYIKKTTNTVTTVCPPYFRPHTVGYLAQNDHFMLTQACREVLGHKVPGLRHLYKPIEAR